MTVKSAPGYQVDLFSDEVIADPYPHYREMRELGPVVWVEQQGMYALSRYEHVRSALADADAFCSRKGVAFSDFANQAQQGTTLATDGEDHDHLRSIIAHGLTPRALRGRREGVEVLARNLVDQALELGSFDAVEVLARAMPLQVVPDLLGWEEEVRPKLFGWAGSAFDISGPPNERAQAGLRVIGDVLEYATTVANEQRVSAGSVSAEVIEAAERGKIDQDQCPALMMDFLVPSLDTTASALGAAFYLFSTHPGQWQKLREDPSLIPNALNEVVRWQSPIRGFTRVTEHEVEIEDSTIPADARVMMIFASANRDERFWDRPEEFDITRENAAAHVGFGYGVHGCAGQGLTRLEGHALLGELVRRVERFERAGEPVLAMNNIIRAYASVPIRAVPAL